MLGESRSCVGGECAGYLDLERSYIGDEEEARRESAEDAFRGEQL
jgi:hypothetical protein